MTDVVTTERLSLIALPADVLDAMLNGDMKPVTALLGTEPPGWWPRQKQWLFGLRRDQLRADPAEAPWLLRAMVTRAEPCEVVGQIGFHEPPDVDGYVEVGYMVFPEHRRKGYAEEAFRALMEWACEHPGVNGIRAAVSPQNTASLNLVGKLGFTETGSQIDEIDGLELIFLLPRR